MSGDWLPPEGHLPVPPEWELPEDEFPEEADQLDAEAEARLSEVTAYLASVPDPVLPDAVGARISAALAAEAAARAGDSGRAGLSAAGDVGTGAAAPPDARALGPARPRARSRRRRTGNAGRGILRSRPLMAVGSVVVCLVLAGLGYGLSHDSGSPAASSASSASGTREQSYAAGAPRAPVPGPSAAGSGGAARMPFVVTASGTRYQAATLAAQARARLAASSPGSFTGPDRPGSVPAATPSSLTSGHTSAPAAALRGCVARLTGGLPPRLVDRATYQGDPAYIIVSSTKVWVVGLNCTAGNPELIASVPLGA